MNDTAVVFGATGLVGKELVKELLGDPSYGKVRIVVRNKLPVSDPALEQLLLNDFSRLEELKSSLKASVFFCCIGTTIRTAGSREAFRQVDLVIPQHIARLAEMLSVPTLVIISSIGADSASKNFYLKTKGEMEMSVRELYTGNLMIVRPSLLMGSRSEYRFGERAATVFMNLFGWMFAGSLKKYRGINARDLARAMIRISEYPGKKVIFESDELQSISSG